MAEQDTLNVKVVGSTPTWPTKFKPPLKTYEVIEHTADIGIRVKGKSLKSLFRNAGLAISQISSQKLKAKYKKQYRLSIIQEADDLEELFLNWLNELLSLSSAKGLIFEDFKISKIDKNSIKALAIGSDIRNYKVNTEIKAATYHELKVKKIGSGWKAEVILDV